MTITLSASNGNVFATVTSWAAANVAAKAIFKRQQYSDLYYLIDHPDVNVMGSIDLEPESFHKPHQHKILTWHLKTFWGNVSKSQPNTLMSQADIDFAKEVVAILPTMPDTIKTLDDVIDFFTHLYKHERLAFHPDTPFEDYVEMGTDKPSYTPEEASIRNNLLDQCFQYCDKHNYDIYGVGIKVYKQFDFQAADQAMSN